MPTPTTCRDIFNAAREKRKAHPLPSGGYKLREAEDRISQSLTINSTLSRWRLSKPRGHCDKHMCTKCKVVSTK